MEQITQGKNGGLTTQGGLQDGEGEVIRTELLNLSKKVAESKSIIQGDCTAD